jgi:hypothetical protein
MLATVAKINRTSVPTNAAADQTLVTTASSRPYSFHTPRHSRRAAEHYIGERDDHSVERATDDYVLACAQEPAHTGDVTNAAGSPVIDAGER